MNIKPAALRYKDIIYYRILAGLKSESRKSYLGYVWFIVEPLLSTAILYFVMSRASGHRGIDTVFSILIGMIIWQWFEGSVMLSSGSISAKFHIHQQVPLPKYLFPLVDLGGNTIRFAVGYTVVLLTCLCLVATITWHLLWLPALILLQFVFIIATSMIISIAVTLISDLRLLLQTGFRMLFFVSGIFFTGEHVPENLRHWFHANPVAVLIESQRAVVIGGHAPELNHLLYVLGFSLVLLAIGAALHNHYDKRLLKLINV